METSAGHAAKTTYTTFDPPGSIYTDPLAVNNSDMVAGRYQYYVRQNPRESAFVRAVDGTITPFKPRGSIITYPSGINRFGVVAGDYFDKADTAHGFIRATDGTITGTYSTATESHGYIQSRGRGASPRYCRNACGQFARRLSRITRSRSSLRNGFCSTGRSFRCGGRPARP